MRAKESPIIVVKNLSKSFGGIKAVDGLSFQVNRQEVIGLLGPNGAGKTTTMRIIAGFLSADSGEVLLDGQPLDSDLVRAREKIGYLPENNPLYKDMLVSEILEFASEIRHIPHKKRKSAFDYVVSAVSIADVYYTPINQLSKGYRQRVGLALALLHRPKVLIMDEPTEGLDPNQRTEIRSLIKKLAANQTVIVSTHVMQEASAVCNRMIIINKGKLVADGTAQQLSVLARSKRVLLVDLEGRDLEINLRSLDGAEHIDISKVSDQRLKAKIVASETAELQPQISRLVQKNKWIVWSLAEEEHGLEEIFHKLTSND